MEIILRKTHVMKLVALQWGFAALVDFFAKGFQRGTRKRPTYLSEPATEGFLASDKII